MLYSVRVNIEDMPRPLRLIMTNEIQLVVLPYYDDDEEGEREEERNKKKVIEGIVSERKGKKKAAYYQSISYQRQIIPHDIDVKEEETVWGRKRRIMSRE